MIKLHKTKAAGRTIRRFDWSNTKGSVIPIGTQSRTD